MTKNNYPRDMQGYGANPPHPRWPGEARLCLQFVINYEEGGENNILHGDAASEAFLSEIVGAQPWAGQRHMNMESIYEYGARSGIWRLHRMFTARAIPVTVFGVASAMARNPPVVAAMQAANWEIASHGLKWIDYRDVPRQQEADDIAAAIALQRELTGERPLGFYQGRSSVNTIELACEDGGFLYCADSYADELPYWIEGAHGAQLIAPYTLDANDMRFATPQGFNAGDQFYNYLRDSFDVLYAEGASAPKMMSIGLHARLVGRPGRAAALGRFLDYAQGHAKVWFARRIDVARHWIAHHPPPGGWRPAHMPRGLFVEKFGGVFEHSPWIAKGAYDGGLTAVENSAAGLHAAMSKILRAASPDAQRRVIDAHPDLAGKLASAKLLSADSANEQASAGLDALTQGERAQFTALNGDYVKKFGHVFIMAVRGRTKHEILAAFTRRLANNPPAEFAAALDEIESIARQRLEQALKA